MSPDAARTVYSRLVVGARLRQWQLVVQVASLGNLRLAAEACGMSQPTATHALAELEKLLGLPLFDRHAKGTRLTELGAAVLPRAKAALQNFYECAEAAAEMRSGRADLVRVGAIGAAMAGPLTRLLPAFGESHPEIAVHIDQQGPDALISRLSLGELDIVLCRCDRPFPADTVFTPLASDHYVVICARDDELATRASVERSELAGRLWLAPPPTTIAARDFADLWGAGPSPDRLCWADAQSPMLIWSIVRERRALAFLPFHLVQQLLAAQLVRRLPGDWGPRLPPIGALLKAVTADRSRAVALLMRALVCLGPAGDDESPALA